MINVDKVSLCLSTPTQGSKGPSGVPSLERVHVTRVNSRYLLYLIVPLYFHRSQLCKEMKTTVS